MIDNEMFNNFVVELRRGSLTLAVLGCLHKSFYGYELLQELQQNEISIEANTLYPLLRRLESQGILTSKWDTTENRPRKYYSLNDDGKEMFNRLLGEWKSMQKNIDGICGRLKNEKLN
ncbi:MAG TPA: PadR family transcriptional regulator [Clostridia bacterium]|nr:PadR family transcriptional regulator [Clostridia bacterium]